MKLTLVRHGRTEFNKLGIVQGQEADPPLNEEGVAQVERAVLQLLDRSLDLIISSPLKRALETAEIMNKSLHKTIILDDRLKELSYGSLAFKTWEQIAEETGDPAVQEKNDNLVFDYRSYGGESADQFKFRVSNFLEEARSAYAGNKVLITTHGGVIDMVRLLFSPGAKMYADNASIHEFEL